LLIGTVLNGAMIAGVRVDRNVMALVRFVAMETPRVTLLGGKSAVPDRRGDRGTVI
jgi:hypothetical protein